MRLTAKQAAERLNISYVVASGLMSHLEDVGKAKVAEKIFHSSGKGKPTRVYEFDNNVVLNFGEDVLQVSVVEPTTVVAEDMVPVVVATEQFVEEIVPAVAAVSEERTVEEIIPIQNEVEGGYHWDDEDEDDVAA